MLTRLKSILRISLNIPLAFSARYIISREWSQSLFKVAVNCRFPTSFLLTIGVCVFVLFIFKAYLLQTLATQCIILWSPSAVSVIRTVSSTYLRMFIMLQFVLIPSYMLSSASLTSSCLIKVDTGQIGRNLDNHPLKQKWSFLNCRLT